MIYILTSSPSVCMDGPINPANEFLHNLHEVVNHPARCVFVTTYPDDYPWSEHCADCMRQALEDAGFEFSSYVLLDRRTAPMVEEIIADSDFIILGGGHVPSQNAFLQEMQFDEVLRGYEGVVMGISAGSMNSARVVYSPPEEEGEFFDPNYQRYLPGLGITEVQIVPHYYLYRDAPVDGRHTFFNFAMPDSISARQRYYAFPDGTYLFGKDGVERIYGEFYVIENGILRKCGEDGEVVELPFI